MKNKPQINRSDRFLLHYQLVGFYEALKFVASNKIEVSNITIELIKNIQKHFLEITSGSAVAHVPLINDSFNIGDLIITCATLLSLSEGFLTEEEKSLIDKGLDFALKVKEVVK